MRKPTITTTTTVIDPSDLTPDATPASDKHRFHARIEGTSKSGGVVLLNLFTHQRTEASARERIAEIAEAEGITVHTLQVSESTF